MDIIIIGGEGNGTVIASTIEDIIRDHGAMRLGGHHIKGFLNDSDHKGDNLNGYPVLGNSDGCISISK